MGCTHYIIFPLSCCLQPHQYWLFRSKNLHSHLRWRNLQSTSIECSIPTSLESSPAIFKTKMNGS